jgi:hypothetical protein
MSTQAIFTTRQHLRRLALIAGVAILAIAAALIVMRALEIQRRAANRVVEIGATYRLVPDLKALTHQADLVVVGRVVGNGKVSFVAQPAQQPQPLQPTDMTGAPQEKADLAKQQSAAPPDAGSDAVKDGHKVEIDNTDPGLPVTTYTIAVAQVLRGQAKAGGQILVNQAGGTVILPTYPNGPKLTRTLEFEHDSLMQSDQEQVLFLTQAPDGSYDIVGGPQGRFTVQSGKVYPVNSEAPVAKGHENQALEQFISEVRAIQ